MSEVNTDPNFATDYPELNVLLGAEVNTIQLGYDVTLSFYGGQNREKKYAQLRINCEFSLFSKTQEFKIDPDNSKTLPPLLELIHAEITKIALTKDDVLFLEFDNGYNFTIKPVPNYEAWTLSAEDLGDYVATDV